MPSIMPHTSNRCRGKIFVDSLIEKGFFIPLVNLLYLNHEPLWEEFNCKNEFFHIKHNFLENLKMIHKKR